MNRSIPEKWSAIKISDLLGSYPKTASIVRDDYMNGSEYPIIDQSRDFICDYTDDKSKIIDIPSCIVFGDHTNFAKYINFPFARGADGTQIINSCDDRISNYLLYLHILSLPKIEQGYSRHYKFLKEQYVLVPDKATNERFNALVNDFTVKIKNNIIENCTLNRLRTWVLPLLMNGQATISD